MLAELFAVIQQLLRIISKSTVRGLIEGTVIGRTGVIIDKRTFCLRITPVVIIRIGIERECQVLGQIYIYITTGDKRVTGCFIYIILVIEDTVATHTTCTVQVVGLSEVIHILSPFIDHDVLVFITEINRIDRSLGLYRAPDGTGTDRTFGCLAVIIFGVVEIRTDFQPCLCLVIQFCTRRQTFLRGTFLDTILIQITDRGIIINTFGSTGNRHVIFLAETVL